MRMVALALPLVVALLAAESRASAQGRPVLVVSWSVGEADPAALAAQAETIAAAVPTRGLSALPLEEARQRFEELGSAEPSSVTDSDIEQWLSLSRQAVRHLARTDYAAAREALLEAQRLSERAAEELNRELTRARQVLDTCLYDVRRYVETNDPRAETRAMECRRLVPRGEPSAYNHTPEVVELLGRVDRRLAESPPGNLRIESDPSGCAVRLNGVEFGRTPFVSEELATGEYRAQIECDTSRRGRVHRIRLGEGTSVVRIDVELDAAIRTDTAIRLAYADDEAAQRRLEHAIAIAEVVGAREVWLAAAEGDGVARIDRVDAADRRVSASVRGRLSATGPMIAALEAGRSEDQTVLPAIAMARWSPGGEPSSEAVEDRAVGSSAGDRTGEHVAGAALGIAGVLAIGGAFGLYEYRLAAGARLVIAREGDPDYLLRYGTWLDRRAPIWVVAGIGGALITAALPLLMSDEPDVPWWSWLIGGAGVGVAVVGVAEIALAGRCLSTVEQEQPCIDAGAAVDRGAIWISIGAPLLAVPIVYLIRSATRAPVAVSVEVTGERAALHLGGSF